MKLTKLQHACFYVELDDQRLLINPGSFTSDLDASIKFDYVVITHEHPDHLDTNHLRKIVARNPKVQLITHQKTSLDQSLSSNHQTVLPGNGLQAGPFSLRFFGGEHAPVHPSLPKVANLDVLINESIYYPGDSFAAPDINVNYLALPISAPWLKINQVIDLLQQMKPRNVFPTHDAILSSECKALLDDLVVRLVGDVNYQRISGCIEI